MAKKSKERSEVEYWKGKHRELSRVVKHLRKELARSNKELNRIPIEYTEEPMEQKEKLDDNSCPKCKAELTYLNLGNRQVDVCKKCNYRKITNV